LEIWGEIGRKLKIKCEEGMMNEERQYFEDPDDSPIPNDFKTFQFVECDRYITTEGLVTFNLDYIIKKLNIYWKRGYTEKLF
jgi:hypothetical protein